MIAVSRYYTFIENFEIYNISKVDCLLQHLVEINETLLMFHFFN